MPWRHAAKNTNLKPSQFLEALDPVRLSQRLETVKGALDE